MRSEISLKNKKPPGALKARRAEITGEPLDYLTAVPICAVFKVIAMLITSDATSPAQRCL